MPKTVAVLFARHDSIYYQYPACDVWDAAREALHWPGGMPIIAHPPCRLWGQLRHFSTAPLEEKHLGTWAIAQVRQWGGVVEHPASSGLWHAAGCPRPSQGRDRYGGHTVGIYQQWFGHRARKATWLYIVGCLPGEVPPIPLVLGEPSHVVRNSKRRYGAIPEITKAEREHTPRLLAEWLIAVAQRCRREEK